MKKQEEKIFDPKEFKNALSLPTGLWSRWWFTKGDQSYEAIYDDMKKSIVDAGIVRIELAKGFVWTDSRENMAAFYYVLKAADQLGLKMDIATGTPYPAENGVKPLVVNGKTYYDPANVGYTPESCNAYALQYAIKDLPEEETSLCLTENVTAFYRKMFFEPAKLTPGQNITVDREKGEKIVGAAALCLAEDGKTILASLNVSDRVMDDCLTASKQGLSQAAGYEGTGTWRILVFYTVFQPGNSVCYLSCNATRSWIKWYEQYVIDNDAYWTEVMGLPAGEVRRLFNRVVTGIWEDSLEAIPVGYTAHALPGTEGKEDRDIFDAFRAYCGYALTPDRWPALFVNGNGLYAMGNGVANDADFVLDPVADKQLRHDFINVLTRLYRENHLDVYTAWAQAQPGRLDTRVQTSYLYALDQDAAFQSVTIPEYESLNSSDRPDSIRAVAGAAHAGEKDFISYEMGARAVSFQHETYTMSWYDWLWHSNVGFAHGINATVLHGIEYLYGRTAKVWPGPCMAMPFAALSEPCGQRMPYFRLMRDTISPYLAREQYVLTRGRPEIDLAVYYYYNEVLNDYLDHWNDPALAAAGYCYDFVGDESLELAEKSFDAEAKKLRAGGYRAIIVNQFRAGSHAQAATGPAAVRLRDFEGKGFMPVKTARRILALAKKGLPVLVVGKAPDKAAAASDNGGKAQGEGDKIVVDCFRELMRLPNVACCESEGEAPEALKGLGLLPAASFRGENTENLFSFHRADETGDYYMLFNRTHTIHWMDEERDENMLSVAKDRTIVTEVTLSGSGEPFRLDCWTGKIEKLPCERISESQVCVHLTLAPSEAVMLMMGKTEGETPECCGALRDEEILSGWTLDLSLYRPAEAWLQKPEISTRHKVGGMTEIAFEEIRDINPAPDGRLLPWKELTALGEKPERASGIGTYRTSIHLPADFDPEHEIAILEIDEATELFTLSVNGSMISFPQYAFRGSAQEITPALKAGENTLEIRVASGLYNAVRYYNGLAHEKNEEITPQLSAEKWLSSDGLMGKVTLKRYMRR